MTETTQTMELIPRIAWEQAVYICLFLILIFWIFTWFGKRDDKWQIFIEASNDKWRQFSKEQREQNQASMICVENSLKDLTTVTQALVSEVREMRSDTSVFFGEFYEHDNRAKDILFEVKNIKPASRSRSKAKVLPKIVEDSTDI